MEEEGFLGGFLFGNVDESGLLDNEDFDKELQEGLSSFVKNARSFGGLDAMRLDDTEEQPQQQPEKDHQVIKVPPSSEKVVPPPSDLDRRLAGLIFMSGGKKNQVRFTNLFRSGTLPVELTQEDDLAMVPSRLPYRLRRYRVRRKKHPKPVSLVEDQRLEFKRRNFILGTGQGPFGSFVGSSASLDWLSASSSISSGSSSRYRVLGQLRHSQAISKQRQSARSKALEALLKNNRRSNNIKSETLSNEDLKGISFDEHAFHPVETTLWEEAILIDDELTGSCSWEDRKLTPKFVEVPPQAPTSNRPFSGGNTSALLSFLASRGASGYSSPPIIRTTTTSTAANLSRSLLKRPESEATRVTNSELEAGGWADSIIWDDEALPRRLPPTRLILDVSDPFMSFDIDEKAGELAAAGGGISLKDVAKLYKAITKAKIKKGMNGPIPTAAAQPTTLVKAVNYGKVQSGDKFNLSNDKHYDAAASQQPGEAGTASVSKATRQSMAKSQLAARIGLQHSVPAARLLLPHFKTGWNRAELRSWHRPSLATPIEPTLTFTALGSKGKTSTSMAAAAQVLRNAKKLGIRDGSEYVLLEYSEENPLLMMNSGMATFLLHFWRKTSPKDVAVPPISQSFGCLKVLEPTDPSPFWMFGDVPAGQTVLPAMQNNLFRALIFEHQASSGSQQDFLAIRAHIKGKVGTKLYLRSLPPSTLLVGQVFPTAPIPGPHSRKQNSFARSRVQVFAYRLFSRDATATVTGRPRLKISRILSAFPQYSEGSIRKWLKEYAESIRGGADSGVWQKKADAPVLNEDDLRSAVTPEMVCTNEAMLVGQQRLQDAGVDLRSTPNPDDGEDEEAEQQDLLEGDDAGELQLAPWNLAANLANAILGKSALQLKGPGDPSGGREEAFSFLRIPTKMASAKISPDEDGPASTSSAGVKRTKGGNVDQAAYKQEIAKIWAAQIRALSNPNPPDVAAETEPESKVTSDSAAWHDILKKDHHGRGGVAEDDLESLHSASQTGASTTARSDKSRRRLVITRTIPNPDGPAGSMLVQSETITDPFLIQAYLKERRQFDVKQKRRLQMATASAIRAANRPAKAQHPSSNATTSKPPKAPAVPKEPKLPKAPKKTLTIRCGTCGEVGHMRTNRVCPLYARYEEEMERLGGPAYTRPSLSNGGGGGSSSSMITLDPGAVRVEGTKISISKPALERAGIITTVAQQRALNQWSLFLQDILAALLSMPSSWPFRRPVSRKEYPHYFKLISKPIDLGTIRSRATRQVYRRPEAFLHDVRLIAANCIQFNLEDHPFSAMAKEVVLEAERMMEQKGEQVEAWMAEIHPTHSDHHVQAPVDKHVDDQEDVEMHDQSVHDQLEFGDEPHDHDHTMQDDEASGTIDV